jgi:hypothetical protein
MMSLIGELIQVDRRTDLLYSDSCAILLHTPDLRVRCCTEYSEHYPDPKWEGRRPPKPMARRAASF